MEEIWRDIKGYENIYQVSNYGRIRSLDRYVTGGNQYNCKFTCLKKGKILKPRIKKHGYLSINLSKNGKTTDYCVHLLVANTFLTDKTIFKSVPREDRNTINLNDLQVNHKDENKQNNNINNLEWCTRKYNCVYGNRGKKIWNTRINKNK